MSVNIINNYNLNASIFLDNRKSIENLNTLKSVSESGEILYPYGFEVFCVEEGAYFVNVAIQGTPEWEQRMSIEDEMISFTTTYSSQKISELLRSVATIEDDIISNETTYSSQKIIEIIRSNMGDGSGGTGIGANINDEQQSATTTYSSQKIESVFSELRQEITRVDDDLLDMDNRVEYLEGEMWKLYGFDGSYNSLTNKPSLEDYATKEYVDISIANAQINGGDGGSIDLSDYATKEYVDEAIDMPHCTLNPPLNEEANRYYIYVDELESNNTYYLSKDFPKDKMAWMAIRNDDGSLLTISDNDNRVGLTRSYNSLLVCRLTSGNFINLFYYDSLYGGYDIILSKKDGVWKSNFRAYILSAYNNQPFTPDRDYAPATKKYVDDAVANVLLDGGSEEIVWEIKLSELSESPLQDGYHTFTIPYLDDSIIDWENYEYRLFLNGKTYYVNETNITKEQVGNEYCWVFAHENLSEEENDIYSVFWINGATQNWEINPEIGTISVGTVWDDENGGYIPGKFTSDMKLLKCKYNHINENLIPNDLMINNSISLQRYKGSEIGICSSALGLGCIATNFASHAEGYYCGSLGEYTHAEGAGTRASGISAHAEGSYSIASGNYSHAEGIGATASGDISHAEGNYTTASGENSHAEGESTTASGYASHAEGYGCDAKGEYSHAEGMYSVAEGNYSHAEGHSTAVYTDYAHVQGKYNKKDREGIYAHIVGNGTYDDSRSNAHTLDWDGNAWFAGNVTVGADNKELATKEYVDDVVDLNDLELTNSLTIGTRDNETGGCSLSIGDYNEASGWSSVAIGEYALSTGTYSFALGYNSISEGTGAFSAGEETKAYGNCSHAEGRCTTASGDYSHAEGYWTSARKYAHAEGNHTTASGESSHAEGIYTKANGEAQHVQGKYNIEDTANTYAHIVGNGSSATRSNAHTLDWDGNAWYAGQVIGTNLPWSNLEIGELIIEQTVLMEAQSDGTGVGYTSDVPITFVEGEKICFTFNGGQYICETRRIDDYSIHIGNGTLSGYDEIHNNEPFAVNFNRYGEKYIVRIYVAEKYVGLEIPIKIEKATGELHKLDEVYLPNTVATKEYVDDSIANVGSEGNGLPLLSSICKKNEDGTLYKQGAYYCLDFDLIPKDITETYYDDISTSLGVLYSCYLSLYKDESLLSKAWLSLRSVYPFVSVGYKTGNQLLCFTNSFQHVTYNLETNTRTLEETYSITSKAPTSAVLTKTNTTEYTPTTDYHPATKKYVDDMIAQNPGGDSTQNVGITTLKVDTEELDFIKYYESGLTEYDGESSVTKSDLALIIDNNIGTVIFEGYEDYPYKVVGAYRGFNRNEKVILELAMSDSSDDCYTIHRLIYGYSDDLGACFLKSYYGDLVVESSDYQMAKINAKANSVYNTKMQVFDGSVIYNATYIEEADYSTSPKKNAKYAINIDKILDGIGVNDVFTATFKCRAYGIDYTDSFTFDTGVSTGTIVSTAFTLAGGMAEILFKINAYKEYNSDFTLIDSDYCSIYITFSNDVSVELIDEIANSLELSVFLGSFRFLTLDNKEQYTPTADYHPATKKYVDEAVANSGENVDLSDYATIEYVEDTKDFLYTEMSECQNNFRYTTLNLGTITLNEFFGEADVGNTESAGRIYYNLDKDISVYNTGSRIDLTLLDTDDKIISYSIANTKHDVNMNPILQNVTLPSGTVFTAQVMLRKNIQYDESFNQVEAEGKCCLMITFPKASNTEAITTEFKTLKLKVGLYRYNFLTLTNKNEFVPAEDYHPATKKYVDEAIANSSSESESVDLSGYALKTELHEHTNKTVIDTITSDMFNKWNQALPFNDTYASDCNAWLTNGYIKTGAGQTSNLPSVCTGSDRWGILFFIAENVAQGTGTQMYFPIDGTYKGRIFVRSLTNMKASGSSAGAWTLLSTFSGDYNDLTNKPNIPDLSEFKINIVNGVTFANAYINYNNGEYVGGGGAYACEEYVPIISGATYEVSGISNTVRIAYYDSGKAYLNEYVDNTPTFSFTPPSNASYIRLHVESSAWQDLSIASEVEDYIKACVNNATSTATVSANAVNTVSIDYVDGLLARMETLEEKIKVLEERIRTLEEGE